MNRIFGSALIVFAFAAFADTATAQIEEICSELGITPGLDSPFAHVPYVYGRVVLRGFDGSAKPPKVVVTYADAQLTSQRWTIDKSGNYCFKRRGGGGEILVEVNGVEAGRRSLPAFSEAQLREDFEIFSNSAQRPAPPGVVSAKFSHPKNDKTVELYQKAADAEAGKEPAKAIEFLNEIVAVDRADFIAWAKLGSLYFDQNKLSDAEAAFRKSLELKPEYTPAWIFAGKIRIAQKQYDAAIGVFKRATELDPTSARAFQLLGEAYLQAKKGTLGAEALNEAIRLDPIGMAECHLRLAKLYDLAGAKHLATREFKAFLAKVPDYTDRKKLEKYIKDNPE
jgi:cytochrome c-type biogenesis protein CcmH/NrfG